MNKRDVYAGLVKSVKGLELKGAAMLYTSVNGNMFSFLTKDNELNLRLPAALRNELIAKDKKLISIQHGVVMKEYVLLSEKMIADAKFLKKYFEISFQYASALKPKNTGNAKPTTKSTGVQALVPTHTHSFPDINKNKKVDDFIAKKKNPFTNEILRVREIILNVSNKIQEDIKWSSPTFIYKGNIASFFMNSKTQVCLVFHYGAFIAGKSGLLNGDGKLARVARFTGMKDVESKKKALEGVIRQWMKMKDAGATDSKQKKIPVKKTASVKVKKPAKKIAVKKKAAKK